MENLRVVSLQASNILRLTAVEFTWENGKRLLTIGGKNGAGKSSVLHAVAMALGGKALCPDEPLKRGEQRGFVELDLDALKVRREFWRDLLTEQPASGDPAYGETKSRLIVKNKDGVKQDSAQRLLDSVISNLSFDPTAFNDAEERDQAEVLRKLVGLDFRAHDEARSIAYDRRAVYNKQHKDQQVLLDAMPKYDGVPDEEVSLAALMAESDAAEVARQTAATAEKVAMEARISLGAMQQQIDTAVASADALRVRIAELQQQLEIAVKAINVGHLTYSAQEDKVNALQTAAHHALIAIPDTTAIQERVHVVEDTNSKIRANVARRAVMNQVIAIQKQYDEQDAEVTRLDALRAKTIRDTKFPVDGLGISHTGVVTFNDIALKQASTAEQIRVSVAIGFKMNPDLKLLCIKNGNALDDDSMALIADAAEKAGGQILMEYVTKNAGEVSVFIEDGHN